VTLYAFLGLQRDFAQQALGLPTRAAASRLLRPQWIELGGILADVPNPTD